MTTHPFAALCKLEILPLLMAASNFPAPGFLGIGWKLLKAAWLGCDKVWGGLGPTLTWLFESCLHLGHHLVIWTMATVVVIPKPNHLDYTRAKAHHSISLLECYDT